MALGLESFGRCVAVARFVALSNWPPAGLFLDRFNAKVDAYFVANVRRVLARVKVGALDCRESIGADGVFLFHWVRHGVERGDSQRHRLGDALDG